MKDRAAGDERDRLTHLITRSEDAAALLHRLVGHKQHRFWPSPEAGRAAIYLQALGHKQVNDAYLIALAERERGRLITLDPKLALHPAGKDVVAVISA